MGDWPGGNTFAAQAQTGFLPESDYSSVRLALSQHAQKLQLRPLSTLTWTATPAWCTAGRSAPTRPSSLAVSRLWHVPLQSMERQAWGF